MSVLIQIVLFVGLGDESLSRCLKGEKRSVLFR